MKTIRIILQEPFYQHPAGMVFDLPAETEPAEWPEDDRVREKQNYAAKQVYHLPDGGRGVAVRLPVRSTKPCPEHAFEGQDLRTGPCRATKVFTRHIDEERVETPPCGQLKEEMVTLQWKEETHNQTFLIDLPPFAEVAEKMVLLDTLQNVQVLEYVLRNYSHRDTQLKWDVSDLHPGFYDLQIHFPGGWFHVVRFIKFFPVLDLQNLPAAPKPAWQPIVDQVLAKFTDQPASASDLPNEALDFCLEWGEMFEKPTQERMMRLHPELPRAEADALDKLAREVRSYVYYLCEQELEGKVAESDLHFMLKRKYNWVNANNFNRMKSVGMYYARR